MSTSNGDMDTADKVGVVGLSLVGLALLGIPLCMLAAGVAGWIALAAFLGTVGVIGLILFIAGINS